MGGVLAGFSLNPGILLDGERSNNTHYLAVGSVTWDIPMMHCLFCALWDLFLAYKIVLQYKELFYELVYFIRLLPLWNMACLWDDSE